MVFGLSTKMIVVGIVALFILLTLGCVAVAVMTPNTSTPTPMVKATVAATATPSAKATTTPSAKATATPKATSNVASFTQSQLTAIETLRVKDGFIIITHFKESGTDTDGDKEYTATMSKNGFTYDYTVEACHNTADADSSFAASIAAIKAMGATGGYDDAYTWTGVMTYNGKLVGAGTQEMRDSNPAAVIRWVVA